MYLADFLHADSDAINFGYSKGLNAGGPLQLHFFPILYFTDTSIGINLNWISIGVLNICFKFCTIASYCVNHFLAVFDVKS